MHTGVESAGHLWVTDPVTKTVLKVYILIFTYMPVRAIHVGIDHRHGCARFLAGGGKIFQYIWNR